jgi:hypothetical protein
VTPEPWYAYRERVWEIYDPNTARLVATFYDKEAAKEYLKFINKRNRNADNGIRSHQGDLSQ